MPPSPPPEDSFEQYREIPVDYTKIDATHEDSALNMVLARLFQNGERRYKIYGARYV
ncbi:MAG: hypothetical protein ACLRTQ_05870 [Candidatus Borkfalkia sp.]